MGAYDFGATADIHITSILVTVDNAVMSDGVVAGCDTIQGNKVVVPQVRVKTAASSTFYHTKTNYTVDAQPITGG